MSPSSNYIAAIDQGTTGTRCFIFDDKGRVVSWDYRKHRQVFPHPAWVEHDPLEIWEKTKQVVRGAIRKAKISGRRLTAVGIANQRETTVVWNPQSGRPFYNAIVWQDARTAGRCLELSQSKLDESFLRPVTGLSSHPYFSSTKIEWLLKNVPGLAEAARRGSAIFGTMDTWLIWNLTGGSSRLHGRTGEHLTDPTNASRTMLMDIRKLQWSQNLLDLFGIPLQMMPEIRPSSSDTSFGLARPDGPFGAEIPIMSDLGDQQAALVGQACFEEGEAKCTYGTGSFLLQNTGDKPVFSRNGLLTTLAFSFGPKKVYALEGSVAAAGYVLTWLRENLGIEGTENELASMAKLFATAGSSDVYLVPAFSGLYAPYWDTTARGLIIGLTQFTKREHIVRAAIESICWQVKDVFEAMTADSRSRPLYLKVDGGGAANNQLMQLQADILGLEVLRPKIIETAALGAAFAAGLATKVWSGEKELQTIWEKRDSFRPEWDEPTRRSLHARWRSAVRRSRGWLDDTASSVA